MDRLGGSREESVRVRNLWREKRVVLLAARWQLRREGRVGCRWGGEKEENKTAVGGAGGGGEGCRGSGSGLLSPRHLAASICQRHVSPAAPTQAPSS